MLYGAVGEKPRAGEVSLEYGLLPRLVFTLEELEELNSQGGGVNAGWGGAGGTEVSGRAIGLRGAKVALVKMREIGIRKYYQKIYHSIHRCQRIRRRGQAN